MSQATPVGYVDTESGTQLVSRLNSDGAAMLSLHSGSSRPSYAAAGTPWRRSDYPTTTLQTVWMYDGTDDILVGHLDTSGNRWYPRLPPKGIAGLITANNGTDPANDIDIAAGYAAPADDADDMVLLSTLVKRLDAAWVVGTNQGGLDTGAEAASTLYAVWLIKRPDTGVVDVLFSTSFTAPTMPTNYTKKRLIGAIYNDAASAIVAFTQVGDYFRYTGDVIQDISDATITNNTFEAGTVSAPPSALAHVYGNLTNSAETASQGRLHIRTAGATDDGTGFLEAWAGYDQSADAFRIVSAIGTVLVNSSRQVEYTASEVAGTATVTIRTLGFVMLTRSNP